MMVQDKTTPPAPAPDDAPPAPAPDAAAAVAALAKQYAENQRLRDQLAARDLADAKAEIARLQVYVPPAPEPLQTEFPDAVSIEDAGPGDVVQLTDKSGAYAILIAPGQLIVLGVPQRHECDVVKVG